MRVLIFVKSFAYPTLTFIYNEIKGISATEEVKVLCIDRLNDDKFPFTNVEILHFPKRNLLNKFFHSFQTHNFLFSYRNKRVKKQIELILNDFKPDIIHTHFGYESWWFLSNLPKVTLPVFISFHGFDASHMLKSSRYLSLIKYFNKLFDLDFIFCSQLMAKTVEEKIGPIQKKHILYYGTNVDFFKRTNYSLPKDPFTFLQVSSFAEKKGHIYTIKAFSILKKNNPELKVRLILAGEGELKNEMIQLSETLNLNEFIEFPGLVNPEQAKELMENSNVFVHHSITSSKGDMEGIPNALMEAMAMELPVISTYHSGIPELVEDDINGYLVEEKDIAAYSIKMKASINLGLLHQNREKVKALFERKKHNTQLLAFYRSACIK